MRPGLAAARAEAERLKLSEARFRNGIASSLDAVDLYRALGGGSMEAGVAVQ